MAKCGVFEDTRTEMKMRIMFADLATINEESCGVDLIAVVSGHFKDEGKNVTDLDGHGSAPAGGEPGTLSAGTKIRPLNVLN